MNAPRIGGADKIFEGKLRQNSYVNYLIFLSAVENGQETGFAFLAACLHKLLLGLDFHYFLLILHSNFLLDPLFQALTIVLHFGLVKSMD